MKIRSKNLQKSLGDTWANSNLYFDTSDGEYWDQENVYLSEHHYEEPLDVETAKALLNFGDDYKQYLESNNSEVQSPRNPECTKKRRTSSKVKIKFSLLFLIVYFSLMYSRIFLMIHVLMKRQMDSSPFYQIFKKMQRSMKKSTFN